MTLSTFHGLKLYRFDMGVGWLVILMCTTGFLNEILGELPKIGRKPSRPSLDEIEDEEDELTKDVVKQKMGRKKKELGISFLLDFYF